MEFVAIDFETANCHPTSACSLGLAVVQGGRIVERRSWLIRPEPFYFDPFTTAIHGLRTRDVQNAPSFGQLWPEVFPYLEGSVVAAHHAAFDIGVLRAALKFYQLPLPQLTILCTLLLSRRAFPSAPSHRLNAVSSALGISLTHHEAESDAAACAQILSILMQQNNLSTMEDLKKRFGLLPGFLSCSCAPKPCRLRPTYALPQQCLKEWEEGAVPDENFWEKSFVFAGKLKRISKRKAMEIVIRGGGIVQSNPASYTDYLVLGDALSSSGACTKEERALLLRQKGYAIQIIRESAFLSLMGADLQRACFSACL